jgi:hypothetical protein
MALKSWALAGLVLSTLTACKPDTAQIEFYTSDLDLANDGEVIETPARFEFSLLGDDTDGDLERARRIALRYLPEDSHIDTVQGEYQTYLVVETTIPVGTAEAINQYIDVRGNGRPLVAVVQDHHVELRSTPELDLLNAELERLNPLLGAELPATETVIRVNSDSRGKRTLTALAVFVNKRPHLIYEDEIKRRQRIEMLFKGSEDSVYHQVPIQFELK